MILYLCTHLLLFRSGNCKEVYGYFFHTHMCMNHTQLYTLYHLPSMGDFIYVFITRFLYSVACHCLLSKALDRKPEFVLKDHFYAVSFIMAWIFTQIEFTSLYHAFGLLLYPYRLMRLVNVQQLAMLPASCGCWCGLCLPPYSLFDKGYWLVACSALRLPYLYLDISIHYFLVVVY